MSEQRLMMSRVSQVTKEGERQFQQAIEFLV